MNIAGYTPGVFFAVKPQQFIYLCKIKKLTFNNLTTLKTMKNQNKKAQPEPGPGCANQEPIDSIVYPSDTMQDGCYFLICKSNKATNDLLRKRGYTTKQIKEYLRQLNYDARQSANDYALSNNRANHRWPYNMGREYDYAAILNGFTYLILIKTND